MVKVVSSEVVRHDDAVGIDAGHTVLRANLIAFPDQEEIAEAGNDSRAGGSLSGESDERQRRRGRHGGDAEPRSRRAVAAPTNARLRALN